MLDLEKGYFLVDKDLTWTSFDVVNKIRYALRSATGAKMKVGHAGTLDPLATGLLIVCYGKMTKEISSFQDMEKEYTGTIKLGCTTPSYDQETEIDAEFPTEHITQDLVTKESQKMLGSQLQRAPIFSAKRIKGVKAYELARKGEEVSMKENEIEIIDFKANLKEGNEIDFRIACSKGTYIRSIAHDLGKNLQSGAHLSALRRTAIGKYRVEDALKIDQVIEMIQNTGN